MYSLYPTLLFAGSRFSTIKGSIVAGIALLALLQFGACSTPAPENEGDFSVESVNLDIPEGTGYIPQLEGPLRVLSATPYGMMMSLDPNQRITVTFSRPMVPLGETPELPEGTFQIEPSIPGTLSWEGSQTLVFRPDSALPPATAFVVRVAPGLTSLDGERLDEVISWKFETPRPMLVESEPARNERFADPNQAFVLRFNQGIQISEAEEYVRLRQAEQSSRNAFVDLSVEGQGDSTLIVRPQNTLSQGSTYELLLLPGLPSSEGRLGMVDTTFVRFTTYDQLKLVDVGQYRPYWEEQQQTDFDPGRGITVTFSTPVRFGDLRKAVSFSPEVTFTPGIEAQDNLLNTTHTLSANWEPETQYTLTIRNLTDQFGQKLTEARKTFRTRAYAPSLQMPTSIVVIEADEQAALPVRATNISEVLMGARRLGADEIVPLVRSYDHQHYYGETDWTKLPDPVAAGRNLSLDLPRNRPGNVPIRLDSLLTNGTGIVAVHTVAPRLGRENEDLRFLALAQVTRLGITAKFSPHQNLIFVTDLATAQPVADAAVSIRDMNNQVRWQGKTDENGRAVSPGWAGLGIEQEDRWNSPVQFAFVERGSDLAFTSSVYRDGLEPYRFNVNYDWSPEAVTETGSVFSDRGLYRAGEDVFVKGILRRKTDGDWQAITDSVRILISDPRNQIVYDRPHATSNLGTFDFQWTAPPTSSQGVYTVRVVHTSDTAAVSREYWEPGDVARGEFRVDAFRTATFAVTARALSDSYVAGDFFEGRVSGRYLFGADMGGQPARISLVRRPGSYAPEGYDGYRFGSYDYSFQSGSIYQTIVEADTTLDENGEVNVRVQLPGNENGTPASLIWSGVVTDPARQQQAGRQTITLHPGLFYIGLKPSTTFLDLSRNNEMKVDVIAVDPAGKPVEGQEIEVQLLRQQWYSVREVGVDGRLVWRSEHIEEPMGTHRLTTEADKAGRLTMPVREGGSYIIRATGRDLRGNRIRTDAYFYATGGGYVAWERTDDDRIELVPERTRYRPGERARLMVQSPFEKATALITVEREGILSSRVEVLEGSAPQIEIPLSEQHIPNVFVSVVLLNGRTAQPGASTDVGKPGFKIGYAELRVDPGTRHLQVEVKPDREQYRPGEEVTVDLQLRDGSGRGVAGEIAFSAADAGVLNLIGYALPDPFDTFYGPRPLGVTTTESRANLIDQRNFGQKEEDMIGGGGDRSFLLRQDFRPLAHWAPAIRTDDRGRAQVTFRLPESLTTFRLMATALTGDNRFGAGRTDIVVTQPLILQHALPRFARIDDTFEAGVLVSNLTEKDGQATITASAEGIVLQGPATRSVTIGAGETREVRFNWTVPRPGAARVRFDARLGQEQDAFTVPFTIALPLTRNASATFASTDESAVEAIRLPEDRVRGLGRFEVRLSSTALVGLDGALQYLFNYPYGCLEQRTSAVRPLLIARNLLDAFDLEAIEGNGDRAVEQWLSDLNDFWTGEGFSQWAENRYTNHYVSAYVVLALAEAREAGYTLPGDLVRQAADMLSAQVRRRSERPEYYSQSAWEDTRILMLYALARNGVFLESEINSLAGEVLAHPNRASLEGVSLLLRTVTRAQNPTVRRYIEPLAEHLRRQIRVEGTTAYLAAPDSPEYGWIFASDTRATAYGLAALIEADPSAELRPIAERMVRYLMQQRQGGHWASTQENAAVVEAFQAYYQAFENVSPDFDAEIRLAGQTLLRTSFEGTSLAVETVSRQPETLPSDEQSSIEITKQGTGTAFYSLLLETFSDRPQPAEQKGLSVERRIQRIDPQGQPTGDAILTGNKNVTIEPGELVRVTLRVSTPTSRNYVVVDDALPAGLEALNAAFETTDQSLLERARTGQDRWWGSFNHTEIRDDRVLLFADYLNQGVHTFTYVARATTPGTFVHPPAHASMMYEPATMGRTATGTLTVRSPDSETASN